MKNEKKASGKPDGYTVLKILIVLPCLAILAAMVITYFSDPDTVVSSTSTVTPTPVPVVTATPVPEPEAPAYAIDKNGVFVINTFAGLRAFAAQVRAGDTDLSARLTTDIKASPAYEWTPVSAYCGTFDGLGHTISGLTINSDSMAGLFSCLDAGTIMNLTLADCEITGKEYVGGICGKNYGTISDCHFDGTINAPAESIFTGGITGANFGSITGCTTTGDIQAGSYAGGIAGVNYADINDCGGSANIDAKTAAGVIAGLNEDGTIDNCFAETNAHVSATDAAGGITGINNSFGILTDCEGRAADVSAQTANGAVTGINYGKMYGCCQVLNGAQSFDSAATVGLNYGTIEEKLSHDGN